MDGRDGDRSRQVIHQGLHNRRRVGPLVAAAPHELVGIMAEVAGGEHDRDDGLRLHKERHRLVTDRRRLQPGEEGGEALIDGL